MAPMDWTPPPRGGGGQKKPDINQMMNDLKGKLPSAKSIKGIISLVVIILVVAIGLSSYYTVQPAETGVVTRFGHYVRSTGPGLHFKLPFGVEAVEIVKTGIVFSEEFGVNRPEESLMLSGDLNVIDVQWNVQYQIEDPYLWLFAVRDGRATIRDFSEAVMRRIVGSSYSDAVLTIQREEIGARAQRELQDILRSDEMNIGVLIVTVKLQDVNPPAKVIPAYNNVNAAQQQREKMINEAQEKYNREIPRAEGEAQAVITEAEGYALEQVNNAQGEAERFMKVYASYMQAKDVTQKRFYLEAMTRIMNSAKQIYVVDEALKGVLPLLNLKAGGTN